VLIVNTSISSLAQVHHCERHTVSRISAQREDADDTKRQLGAAYHRETADDQHHFHTLPWYFIFLVLHYASDVGTSKDMTSPM
jgi:hypothetical protein